MFPGMWYALHPTAFWSLTGITFISTWCHFMHFLHALYNISKANLLEDWLNIPVSSVMSQFSVGLKRVHSKIIVGLHSRSPWGYYITWNMQLKMGSTRLELNYSTNVYINPFVAPEVKMRTLPYYLKGGLLKLICSSLWLRTSKLWPLSLGYVSS